MTRPSTRTTPFSQKDRDVRRRHERRMTKLIRRNEHLQELLRDPNVARHVTEIEFILESFYMSGYIDGGYFVYSLIKK